MRALITGMGGFIGSHLADLLLAKDIDVYGTIHVNGSRNIKHVKDKVNAFQCDVSNKQETEKLILDVEPDLIFHLAAQSLVIPSWKDPEKTFKSNINGTLNVLEAARKQKNEPVIFIACSSAEYGLNFPEEIPINEKKEFRPSSPYAVSKISTDMLGYLYWQAHKMNIIRGRFFNITGPRKTSDACSDFAKMIAEAENGKRETIPVGNLDGIRDLTDVRDAVKAVWTLIEKGRHGDIYNICSGSGHRMKDILEMLMSFSTRKTDITTDREKIRPLEDPIFIGNNSKIKQLGWKNEIPIEKTLKDILDYWRHETQ